MNSKQLAKGKLGYVVQIQVCRLPQTRRFNDDFEFEIYVAVVTNVKARAPTKIKRCFHSSTNITGILKF